MKQRDPAFLFYPSDFMMGTFTMTNEQVGMYIKLLCVLHANDGKLTEKQMLSVTGIRDDDVYEKFTQDESGLYFNKRLLEEINKRKEHSKKQRENINKRWNNTKKDTKEIPNGYDGITNVYTKTIPLENENENEDVNEIKDVIKDVNALRPKALKEVITYFDNKDLNNTFIDFITMRKSLKNGAMTERAISMMINKINKHDEQTAIEMLNQSILNNWKDIFEVKEDFQRQQKTKKQILDDDKNKQMLEVMRERGIV